MSLRAKPGFARRSLNSYEQWPSVKDGAHGGTLGSPVQDDEPDW